MTDLPIGQGYLLLLPGASYEVTDAYAVEALRQRDAEIARAHAAIAILRAALTANGPLPPDVTRALDGATAILSGAWFQ